ncbi:MAG: prolipoprotein diacylglyceryl transferase [Bernardetiaceae bacterium]|jgi:prolipoprotein diacylglyceryltransferase|nr:prolipoprotein diacylglyceryl transferase [Bernardetiaceae bacterium]
MILLHWYISPSLFVLHPLFEVLAYTIGYRYYQWLRRHQGDPISDPHRLWIFIGAAGGALVGAYLLGALENPNYWAGQQYLNHLLGRSAVVAAALGNKTIVGGLLGGLLGVELTKWRLGVRTSSGDLMAYPLVLGLAIGRVGCLLGGLKDGTVGVASSLPWAIDFGDGVPRHPTSLYEIIFLLSLGLGLKTLERHFTLTNGARFKLFLASYLVFRFAIEFIKPVVPVAAGLGSIQWACLGGGLYYWRVFWQPRRLLAPAAV